MLHAARSRRWRVRHQLIEPDVACSTRVMAGGKIVTHQGSPDQPADAPLLACKNLEAEVSVTANPDERVASPAEHAAGPMCRRCGATLSPWVRQSFLRRSASSTRAARHDHSP